MCVCAQSLSHVRLCDLWIVARQTPPSMGILQARILEWVACPPPGDSPKPGIETGCHALQADSYRLNPREAHSGGNRLVDTGKRSTTSAPEAWARVGKLSFIGCRRGSGKSHHGAHRVFSCPWNSYRSGPQDWSPGSSYLWGLWHLWSVEGTEMAPFPGGRGLILGRSVNSKDSRKGPYCCFRSAIGWSVRLLTVRVDGSSPPRDGGVGF